STHIEPNVDWGFEVFNEVAEVLYDLKGATKAAPPVPALASYDADRNSLKIALDGFPLEYRISNDETLDGAQWEFLDLREGGIKPGSGINRSEPIYIQTRNSFGESTAGSIAIPSGDLWSISFQVSDGDGALEGVTVQCDGRSVNTGTDGAAAIDDVLAGGSIAYTITKDGYKTVTGTMDLFKDEMVEITLTASGITPGDLWEMVDDVNESVTYSGIWATGAWDGYHRNTCHYTSEKDAKASFTFTGTGIKLIGAVNTNLGMAEVYIDGLLIDTIDFYRDTMALQVVLFADSTLSAGEHTIAIVATNTQRPEATGSFVFIDAFAVKEGPDHVSSRTDESFVKLFPNPSAGSFWISNIQGSAEIRIYSISGKLMHRERTESGQTSHAMEIGVGDLGAGVYLVRVDGENQHETIKLIIENYE
ncbi:MAG: T9SS type A sorting domain-containing protein, partial [Bacteroidota bacterium]